ncbi:ABC transporter permease [uncultured Chitinophaga sp.]|uniref:ABC transporter permease n=1 Tax=uncultured Chitinophaga sp. TaxID=339340 RepID=UPI0025CBAB50|nr:ABC transporter permease [uncultured Chitinophaga sp.]
MPLSNIIRVLLREVKLVATDHSLLLTLLIAPLLYAFFYGSIYSYKLEEKVPLSVVDDDRSALSRQLVEQIGLTQMVQITYVPDLQTAQENIKAGVSQGLLYIEKGMERKVMSMQQAHMVVALNAARFLPSSDLLAAITRVGLTVGAGVRLKYSQMGGLNNEMAMQETQPVILDYRPLFNEQASYGAFLLPGLLALILQQTLLIGISGGAAAERGRGTFNGLMQSAGYNISAALWGKGLFYLVLFCCYAFFFTQVNFNILHIDMRGSGWQLAVVMLLFLLTLIPMGLFIGWMFRSQLLCTQIMAFSTYPFFLVTGYTWPLEKLPPALKAFSALLPTTPFLELYQGIVQQGADISDRAPALVHLAILWLSYTLICLWKMKRLTVISDKAVTFGPG